MGKVVDKLTQRLQNNLNPDQLEITDQSESHRDHTGWRESGETHFHVRIIAQQFNNCSRVQRQRIVYEAVGDLMDGDIHALSIEALPTPD